MTDTASPPGSRRWLMLPVVLLAMFMAGFDIWVVNVAAPSLQRDLHVSDAALQLIVGGYAFMYASGMVTGGRLGDLVGYRRMFMTGVASFAVASLLCGLAQSPAELVGARLLQGLHRRGHGAAGAGADHRDVPGAGAEPGAGLVRRHHGAGLRVRPDPRRPAAAGGRTRPGLAGHLPGERAGGRGHADRRGARGPARARAPPAPAGPARRGRRLGVGGAGAGAADAGPRRGLARLDLDLPRGLPAGVRAHAGLGAPADPPGRRAAARPAAVPRPGASRPGPA